MDRLQYAKLNCVKPLNYLSPGLLRPFNTRILSDTFQCRASPA